jgi:hypothetical protein
MTTYHNHPVTAHMNLGDSLDRQLDIPYANGNFYILPRNIPGRLLSTDFVYFTIPSNMNASQYNVLIDSLDTAGPPKLIKISLHLLQN